MTWPEMVALEPALGAFDELLQPTADWHDYGRAKTLGDPFVGWGARKPELRTSEAWQVFLDRVKELLWL